MLLDLLLSNCTKSLVVEGITAEDQSIIIKVKAISDEAPCPTCGTLSRRIHSRYFRRPRDLPWAQVPVRLQLQVRRFRCEAADCQHTIFAERFPTLVAPSAQRTQRLEERLAAVALAVGGQAGARLVARLGLAASANTLLRVIRRIPLPCLPPATAIGIDEWAWRKGRRYGTILVDLDSHQVIGLLPDCRCEQVAEWLRQHPNVKIISRDRSSPFANGPAQGAPVAIQVADRFHLLQNLSVVLKRTLERHARQVASIGRMVAATDKEQPRDDPRRQQRQARYEEAKRLSQIGMHAPLANRKDDGCMSVPACRDQSMAEHLDVSQPSWGKRCGPSAWK